MIGLLLQKFKLFPIKKSSNLWTVLIATTVRSILYTVKYLLVHVYCTVKWIYFSSTKYTSMYFVHIRVQYSYSTVQYVQYEYTVYEGHYKSCMKYPYCTVQVQYIDGPCVLLLGSESTGGILSK